MGRTRKPWLGLLGAGAAFLMQAGYACQRDAYMQEATLGQEIKKDFQRGDLVFWKGHVGILQNPHQLFMPMLVLCKLYLKILRVLSAH